MISEELESRGGWPSEHQTEEDYDRAATYFVPDRPCPENTENRAEATLPRNLCLKPAAATSDVSENLLFKRFMAPAPIRLFCDNRPDNQAGYERKRYHKKQ